MSIVLKGVIVEKTQDYILMKSGSTHIEVSCNDIESPALSQIHKGKTKAEITISDKAIIKARYSIKDIITAGKHSIGIETGGIVPVCRCDCFCDCKK
jgi:hypothetical protein